MTKQTIIQRIATFCNISLEDAQLELEANIKYLQELLDNNDLRCSDIFQVCQDLGLESDFSECSEYFVEQLTF